MKKICLIPKYWNEFENKLKKSKPIDAENPPIPLILAGWNYSSDSEKEQRWIDTIEWCKKYGFEAELELLNDDDFYYGE